MNELAETLGLSDEQSAQLQTRMRELFAGGAPGGGSGDTADRRKRMESIFKSVLTDAQWEQYQAQQREGVRFGTVWVLTDAGKLELRRVRLGLSDNSYTEIIGGELTAGDIVVLRENRTRS